MVIVPVVISPSVNLFSLDECSVFVHLYQSSLLKVLYYGRHTVNFEANCIKKIK